MRTNTYRRVRLTIEKQTTIPGVSYRITGEFKNKTVVAYTNDSTIYDYLGDDEQPRKNREATKSAYNLIKNN